MDQARRSRILQKTAGLFGPSDAVVGAQKNFAAGGTLDQQIVNDSGGSLPTATTLQDRVRLWNAAGGEQRVPWRKYDKVSTMYEPPASTGFSRGDQGLAALQKYKNAPFDLVHGEKRCAKPGSLDCSGFVRKIEGQSGGTDWIVNDAKSKRSKFREISHRDLQAGDYLVYPGTDSVDAAGKKTHASGHVAMYGGQGKIIDQSSSGHGANFRAPPLDFAVGKTIAVRSNRGNRPIGPAFDASQLRKRQFSEAELPPENQILATPTQPAPWHQRAKNWLIARAPG